MTKFRPCIDLHEGQVKQIVGGTLSASGETTETLRTNFVADKDSADYAEMYKRDGLEGGHVIKLGPNNDEAALRALAAWPNGLQVGGGITDENAEYWIARGASKVIVTSWLFPDARLSLERAQRLKDAVGRERVVIDLSCRKRLVQARGSLSWFVAMNKWQTVTEVEITPALLQTLSDYAGEFLVHAADVEGLCKGIDEELVAFLGEHSPVPCTYAGGGKDISDLALVERLSGGRVDLTFGSALDIFGGSGVKYEDCVGWNKSH